VLRDEGKTYARRLRAAGVDVTATRYGGVVHDFVMLNALCNTNAARAATAQGAPSKPSSGCSALSWSGHRPGRAVAWP
jgi:acetyl esterase/lipase